MKQILILILLIFTGISFAQKAELTTEEKTKLPQGFLSLIDVQYGENKEYRPREMKDEIISFGETFYLDGYVTKAGYAQIKCKFDELIRLEEIISSNSILKDNECVLNTFSKTVCKTNTNINTYRNNSNANCDVSGVAMNGVVPKTVTTENGTKPMTKHFELWKKIYSNYIEFVMTKVEQNKANLLVERNNATAGKCKEPLIRDIDFRKVAVNSCIDQGKECSGHLDCCTGVCNKARPTDSKGLCSYPYSCYKEIAKGQKCGTFNDGFVNIHCKESSCLDIDYNSSDINECKGLKKSCSSNTECCSDSCVAGKCKAQSKCLECAQNGEAPTSSKECCPGLYKSTKGKCIPDFPPLLLPIVQNIINFIIPSAHAFEPEISTENGDGNTSGETSSGSGTSGGGSCVPGVNCEGDTNTPATLTAEQIKEIERKTSECLNGPAESRSACLDGVNELRKKYLAEAGQNSQVWDRARYLEEYNATAITSKTYSDTKKCEFNSFNDSWRDMSNVQRNAEMVTRGFEYVYTGDGTEDYWVNKQGKNIFSRAKSIAKNLRKNRSELIKKMHELDIRMACQCIAIFGVGKFSTEKQAFFNSGTCDDEKSAIGQMNIGNVDGSSQSEDAVTAEEGETSEIDAGATGISHEKMLVEWLKMKYELQMERFVLNSEIEDQMDELVHFTVEETDWEKGKMEETELYKFTVRKMAGWLKIVIAIVIVAAAVAITVLTGGAGAALFTVLGTAIGSGVLAAGIASFVAASLLLGLFGKDHGHYFNDEVRKDWHCINWLCTHKDKDLTRYYVAPHYKNYDINFKADHNLNLGQLKKDKTNCDVRATSGQCLKNSHLTVFNEEPRFLVDIKNPLFVGFGSKELDTKHVSEINKGFDRGILKLKSTYPGSRTNVRFLKKNFLSQEKYMLPFLRDNGNYKPAIFSDKLKKKFLSGVIKYAACKDLVGCGAPSEYEGEMGFGYLFENESDMINFSEYVYQHHFHWPSLTATNFLGYPLMAQRAYFETVFHNIRLVGSLAAAQGAGYGDAYFKYQADWDKRRSLYDAAGKVKVGDATRNVEYSREFLDTFNMLNFSTGDGVAMFDSAYKNLKSDGKLNSFEERALEAGRNAANRALSSKAKRDNYLKQTKGDPRAKAKQKSQVDYLNKIGAPLNSAGLTVGGQNLGNTGDQYKAGGGLTANAISKQLSDSEKSNSSSSTDKNNLASFDPSKYNNSASYGNSSASSSYGQDYSNYDDSATYSDKKGSVSANQKASGMSQEEIERMLSASKDDKELNSTEGDNIFTAVSKAYKRNYDVFFDRRSNKRSKIKSEISKELDSDEKKKLKKLLGN